MRAREEASDVVGQADTVTFRAHNVTTGMTDYKASWAEIGLFAHAVNMLGDFDVVLDALTVNPQRSLEELEDDWTTSMELAETLQKEHHIPFRVGHGFASSIVTFARANGFKPKAFPYAKAVELYADAIHSFQLPDAKLPMDEAEFRQVLSPEFMVKTRVGIGGPQPAEVERQLGEALKTLEADKTWMETSRGNIRSADARLDASFRQLLAP
jgi:argininosuccinate lyase